jgi:hypothetical protein
VLHQLTISLSQVVAVVVSVAAVVLVDLYQELISQLQLVTHIHLQLVLVEVDL